MKQGELSRSYGVQHRDVRHQELYLCNQSLFPLLARRYYEPGSIKAAVLALEVFESSLVLPARRLSSYTATAQTPLC
jgi:hypothetical protein